MKLREAKNVFETWHREGLDARKREFDAAVKVLKAHHEETKRPTYGKTIAFLPSPRKWFSKERAFKLGHLTPEQYSESMESSDGISVRYIGEIPA